MKGTQRIIYTNSPTLSNTNIGGLNTNIITNIPMIPGFNFKVTGTVKHETLLSMLAADERFRDFKIVCPDGEIMAHRCVLANSDVEFFKTYFGTAIGNGSAELPLDLPVELARYLIQFAYGDYTDVIGETTDYNLEHYDKLFDHYLIIDRFRCTKALELFKIRVSNYVYYINIDKKRRVEFVELCVKEKLEVELDLGDKVLSEMVYDDEMPLELIYKVLPNSKLLI